MILVSEIWDDAKEVFGHCDEKKLLRQISDSVQLLANKGELDCLVGGVDICVDGQCVTLPREVETPLAVNIGGHPALGRDELFNFHLNGPGDFSTACDFTWQNTGSFPTYRDLRCPAKVIAFLDSQEDEGKELRVFGFDEQNRPLRSKVGNEWRDGYLVPTIATYALPDISAPLIGRITEIYKAPTVGNVRLSSFDNSSTTGTLLGVFEPDETHPHYRRIKLNRAAEWVRMKFRRRTLELVSQNDRIYLHSRLALRLAFHAVKKYGESDISGALGFEAQATRILSERESVLSSPNNTPIQVEDRGTGMSMRGEDVN